MATKTKSSMKKPAGHNPAGGAFSSKKKEVPIRTGPPSTEKINPKGVGQIGQRFGNPQAIEKIHAGTMPQVELGNSCALRASGSKAGPGADRDIHPQGMQGVHSGKK